jgi:uncharacterized membrane protein YhaH (DUF805 family)
MFENPFSSKGRIRRTEYGLSYIIYAAAAGVLDFLAERINPIIELALIPVIWFLLAQGAKRCHDRDNTGWYQIIPFYIIWMIFADGDIGYNRYGPNPKGIGNDDENDDIGKHLVE